MKHNECPCGHPDANEPHATRDEVTGRRLRCPHARSRLRRAKHNIAMTREERWEWYDSVLQVEFVPRRRTQAK